MEAEFNPSKVKLPLKGFMVGNGVADWDLDNAHVYDEVFYGFSMIPHDLHQSWVDNGCDAFFNGTITGGDTCVANF